MQFFNHPEGYVDAEGSGYKYVYQYKDHLGNIRLSYSDADLNGSINPTTEILSESNYYPFGLEHKGYNNVVNGTEYNYKQYQGQEFTEDLGLNIYEFAFRGYDPAIGRFMQIDPLAEDYVYNSTYAFAENKVINSRELEGLEAWESINNWDEKTIQQYRDYASQRAEEYRTNGTSCTCEDLAVNVLIDFASENKLPVYFENGTGKYDSSSDTYDNIDDFRNDVLVSTGATDLANTTKETSNNNLLSGDLILFTNDKGRITHTQVVTSADSETIGIHQGNFVSNWEMFNNLKWSSDPQSSHYLGAKIQTGLYLKKTGDYYRDGKTNGLLNSDATQGRTWNFGQFNWRESIWDSYYQSKKN